MSHKITRAMKAVTPTRCLIEPGDWSSFCDWKSAEIAIETNPYKPGDLVTIDGKAALILEPIAYPRDNFNADECRAFVCKYKVRFWARSTWCNVWQYAWPGFIDEGLMMQRIRPSNG